MGDTHAKENSETLNSRLVPLVFILVIGTNIVSSIYASAHGRGLYADASAGLVNLYRGLWLGLSGTRGSVEVLRQMPVALFVKFTSASLFECGELFTFVMLALPNVLCAICWPLAPRRQKAWTLFPLTSLLVGFAATSMHAVGEAAIATSYYWILLFLLQFRSNSILGKSSFLLCCIPAYRLHEGTFPLSIILLIVLFVRRRNGPRDPGDTIFFGSGVFVLTTIIASQIVSVIYPVFPGDRAHIIHGLTHLEFLYSDGRFNLPLFTGLFAMVAIGAVFLVGASQSTGGAERWMIAIAIIWGMIAVTAIIVALFVEKSFSPYAQAQARYHPPITSFALALAMVLLIRFKLAHRLWMNRATIFILISLCAAQTVADAVATRRWNAYVADLQSRLVKWRGVIPWEDTLKTGDERADINWRLFNIAWLVPYPCIIFAPNGTVRAIIDLPKGTTFRPLDPERPDHLPILRGINYSSFQRAVAASSR